MTPQARVDHRLPGRVRLRIPAQQGNPPYFTALAEALGAWAGVERVHGNPRTGGVLIVHSGIGLDALAQRANDAGWFELPSLSPPPATPLIAVAERRLAGLSRWLQAATRGEVDGRAVVFLVLIALAGRQILKGQYHVAPTVTLLWYAGQLLMDLPTNRDSDSG